MGAGRKDEVSGRWPEVNRRSLIVKNLIVLGLVAVLYTALETGYLYSEHPTLSDRERLARLMDRSPVVTEYATEFLVDRRGDRHGNAGVWSQIAAPDVGHGASWNGELQVALSGVGAPGAIFHFVRYRPGAVYRVTLKAEIDGHAVALVVRNRSHEIARASSAPCEVQPCEITLSFLAPYGSLDLVKIALMLEAIPGLGGRMSVRRFQIERLID